MRISKSKPLSEMKTIIDIDCREDYILEALGYSKDSVVLSREEFDKLKHYEWRVTSGVCMTQKEWFDFCNEDSNRRTCLRIEEREKELVKLGKNQGHITFEQLAESLKGLDVEADDFGEE